MMVQRAVRIAVLIIAALATAYFLWWVRASLYPFVIAFLMAFLLNPAVCYLERRKMPRLWAIIVIYICLLSTLIISTSYLVPVLIRELEVFARELPTLITHGDSLIQSAQSQYQNTTMPYSLRLAFDNGLAQVEMMLQNTASGIVDTLLNLVSHGVGIVTSPILAFYFLYDSHEMKRKFYLSVPGSWRPGVRLFLKDINKVLNGVIRGQVTIAVIVGFLVSVGLTILDVRFALLIGLLAGALDVIPYFGAFIGATPAIVIALLDSPLLAGKVALLFFAIHQLEGTVIGPRILGEQVGLHPITVIFYLLVGGEVGGLAGLLLGVPLAALGKVVLRHALRLCIHRPTSLSND
ncbi:MAG: tqsA 2 [Anaerosporomusa subterranea]|nr:tqsA 2 [Anaerosporomusa subterranea]